MKSINLLEYESDTNSQNGEDGMIAEIIEHICTTMRSAANLAHEMETSWASAVNWLFRKSQQ